MNSLSFPGSGFSDSFMASCQFVEELLVQCIILLAAPGGHEDVAANVFVHDLTVRCHAAKGDVDVTVEFNGDLQPRAMF